MTIVACNYNLIKRLDKPTDNYLLLTQFITTKLKCAEVKEFSHVDVYSCANSLRGSVKAYDFDIEVICKNGHVYLVNNKIK